MAGELRVFRDAVAIVTGAASGIGRALSEELCARGAIVVMADIDGADAEAIAAGLRAQGCKATAQPLDVTRQPDVARLVADTFAQHGRLDFLFNNAGIGAGGDTHEYSLAAWTRVIDVNLNGVVYGVHAAYPLMVKQGFGHIVNTASTAGLVTSPGMASYTTTKHAVVGLSKALRAEGHVFGVRVSALCPGVIRTKILEGGRHGVLQANRPEAAQRRAYKKMFEQFRPMDPAPFARQVLDQVARNVQIIIVPGYWRVLWWLERLSPALMQWLSWRLFQRGRAQMQAEIGRG
jgi:NAD(P)-dependent dehydrogenase (short-subunit alcohol dehydrogenase family)